MAILATEINYRLSGGAANNDGNASIGGAISSNDTNESLNGLFDQVSGDESAAGDVEYRCVYIQNNNGTLTAQNPKVWIETQTTSNDTDIAIGLGDAAVGATEAAIADEETAPANVTFSQPADKAGGLDIPDLAPGEYIAVWIRRTINAAAAAINNDASVLRFACDSAE